MDGLSSASGVFAAVSIAIQLGESIKKLVEFGKAVQDAPAHIRALFHDLEVLAAVICQIKQLNGNAAFDYVNEKALLNCREKISRLQKMIDRAQVNLKSKSLIRQKWGAFKFTLKKDEVQAIQRSIEEAKTTLQLAQTKSLMYTFYFHHSQPSLTVHQRNCSIGRLHSNTSTRRDRCYHFPGTPVSPKFWLALAKNATRLPRHASRSNS